MKRLFIMVLLLGLLLAGCGEAQKKTPASTQLAPTGETTAATTGETVSETQEVTTAPTQEETLASTHPETVTVYLLEGTALFDSGSTIYYYDEAYNVVGVGALTIEMEKMYNGTFENLDANGMAAKYTIQWPDGTEDSKTITYDENGKIASIQMDEQNYSGYQFAYDAAGNMTEQREYYEGILETAVYYTYENGVLTAAQCEDADGNIIYICRVEEGRILERNYPNDGYKYVYTYDENGNLVSDSVVMDGETIPGVTYTYMAVEVDYDRACWLTEQQRILNFLG